MNGADGLASLVLIEAVKQAAETGQTVYLDEFSLVDGYLSGDFVPGAD